ncbi:pentapeptide repeat-containing protein [Hyphobacterium indicum]|uniref:pentapeptide repeat-containing protein n=1 Tax=Hyphobacterium indicum TaxID=2162714 RepID=UPI0013750E93|nr:pentapeptide repeat-containing protein [Hyphobacterium indicum]
MKRFVFYILAGVGFLTGSAFAGDTHPHRTITISGECHSCELARENLYGAEILGALFIDANLDDTNLNQSLIVETRFMGSELNRTDFTRARLSGVLFHGSSLHGAIFARARGERVRFDSSDLSGADLSHSLMILANFMNADLSEADLTSARLFNARFDDATLTGANFSQVRIPGAVLRGVQGHSVRFTGADMRGVDMSGAELTEADFEGADLNGARLSGTVLIDVRGLTPSSLRNACRDAESRLPEGLELVECSELPLATGNATPRTVTFAVTRDRLPEATQSNRPSENVIRLELIREEQERAVAEFEGTRDALAATRQAIAEAQAMAMRANAEVREDVLQETARSLQEVEAAEAELRRQQEIMVEQLRNNPDLLRIVQGRGERLIFRDGNDAPEAAGSRGPSVIVDGNRYQLNGRYRWVFEMPVPPEAPSEPATAIDPLGPKGPGDTPAAEND